MKRLFRSVCRITLLILSLMILPASAVKISDYEFENDDEQLICANRAAEKCVALTFDDGPHAVYTPQILDILDRHNAKATFFVIGENAENNPELVLEEYHRGHEIGNHTYSHPTLKTLSTEQFRDEVQHTGDVVEEITGTRPILFRPPGGYLNNRFVSVLRELDYAYVLWSWRQDTRDWSCPTVSCVVSTVLDNLQDGDIILFHDYNSGQSPTPEALELILRALDERGFRCVTVSELKQIR